MVEVYVNIPSVSLKVGLVTEAKPGIFASKNDLSYSNLQRFRAFVKKQGESKI